MSHQHMNGDKLQTMESNDGGALGRQMTMQLSPDQYERLFFQPSQAKGDLAKRLGKWSVTTSSFRH